ncbi:hypothetical protein LDENG_00251570 [Lucifuga dentata]|nr:hypothetical protein LDENG_00251570 [Lucifuga dentata]
MERVIAKHLLTPLADCLDPLQFAYKTGRGTDDAALTLMNTITKHLQQPKSSVRLLFIHFTSVFNCMRKHILIKRLYDLNVTGDHSKHRSSSRLCISSHSVFNLHQ